MKRKVIALLVALMVLAASMSVAFAYTVSGGKTGHVYTVYQLFTGDLADDEATLSNLKWPSGDAFTEEEVEALKDLVEELDGASEFTIANEMYDAYFDTAEEVGTLTSPSDSIEDLPAGYYIIIDTTDDDNIPEGEARTLYVLQVLNDVDFEPKTGTTTSEKKVDDVNDSTEEEEELVDSADYDIGDDVPYTLTATLSERVHDYHKYHITFVDELSDGLEFKEITSVTVDGDAYTDYELTETGDGFELTIEWEAADGEQLSTDLDGIEVEVKFTATLTEDAKIGSEGNPNTFRLKYSNNPNDEDGEEEGTTPDDTVIVFTYKVVVNKLDENEEPLSGAGFVLYKVADNYTYEAPTDGNYTDIIDDLESDNLGKWESDGDTTFSFEGIDDGRYVLVETQTPDGYNSIAPIVFDVEAEHETEETEKNAPKLTSLSGDELSGEIEFTADLDEGSLSVDVINQKGVVLPSTGGIGTTIFYVAGSVLVLAAVILLVTKRRMSAND